MRPHLRLHVTRDGEWWVSLCWPSDPGYTVATTANYLDSRQAVIAAAWMLETSFRSRLGTV